MGGRLTAAVPLPSPCRILDPIYSLYLLSFCIPHTLILHCDTPTNYPLHAAAILTTYSALGCMRRISNHHEQELI